MMTFGSGRSAAEEAELDECLRLFILHEAVTPYFQPIVDLTAGTVWGYEVVTRARPPLEMPDDLFPRARRLGLGLEFEYLCLRAAFRRLKSVPAIQRGRSKFFINLTASLFGDERLLEELSKANLRLYDLEESNLVLEFSERDCPQDPLILEQTVRDFLRQGYAVALDDFGCGKASFAQLLRTRPQYLKLDRDVVKNIHLDQYRQHLVKSIAAFAGSVECRLVAEGVEYWEELECLMRLGVRYVQGFLFGMPESEPLHPSIKIMESMQDRVKQFHYGRRSGSDENISNLIVSSHVLPRSEFTCAALGELFQENIHLDHVLLLHEGRPWGLLTRQHFTAQTTGPYGFPLFQTQQIDGFAKRDLLIIEEKMPVEKLARLAMDRVHENLYDPVFVVDAKGVYIGTITMKALIARSYEMEVRRALDTNPLTSLPGNRAIERWIDEAIRSERLAVIYADLDRFKEYNDAYGFLAGDEMIRLVGRVLSQQLGAADGVVHLGHVGGDDFIVVALQPIPEALIGAACSRFDQEKLELFSEEHVNAGAYESVNRQGQTTRVPLVTLSLAVINGHRVEGGVPHPALLSQRAAVLKKKAKEIAAELGRSSYLIDRRDFPSPEEMQRSFATQAAEPPPEYGTPLPTVSPARDPKFLETLDWGEDWAARPD
jgi:diguanylate cyclase (GGDEF)-like protein